MTRHRNNPEKHVFDGHLPQKNGTRPMRSLNLLTLFLIIVGGLNWLLVGLFQFDLVAAIFGGQDALLARVVYVLVGLSALWQIGVIAQSPRPNDVHIDPTSRNP
jgi:uncharacterized membrane protein YuzA (DUF378 family)